uniref:Mitochondrial import receptor subunit TOM22 homolog n=1 Tax=Panthera leo TaxID=9689 RepID=A0A8C8XUC2_PANLE
MVPERVRSMAGATFHHSLFGAQKMCRFSRPAFMILVLPVVFEIEKLRMEQQRHPQRRQILTPPNLQPCPPCCTISAVLTLAIPPLSLNNL